MTEKARLLVVDDDQTTCDALSLMLGLHNYHVTTVNSALQALDKMAEENFDLVLADLAMPGMDGLDLLDEIQKQYLGTPVVIITAYPATEIVIQALRRGASDFITKPYHPGELLTIVWRETTRTNLDNTALPNVEMDTATQSYSDSEMDEIGLLLAGLRAESNASCVLLVDLAGRLLAIKGFTEELDIPTLAKTAANNIVSSTGMASAIGEAASFRLNYFEGERHSVYSALVNPETFLLIVFGHEIRTGMVQLAARQALPRLRGLIEFGSQDALPTMPAPSSADIRREMAIDLYRRHLLNIEKACDMAGVSAEKFRSLLIEQGIQAPE
jgi:CheY-like chemotaxis protein